ncbi:universal stress protein [Microbacterium profundi]|uniref:universal stress protein n=1 Tax=Microbacterium profundi TaxID=450380 RepID=UPI0019D19285|nr:universal stress protein [Microbacterium profundi]MCE7481818.1 universal stress protein [Microbacterium profundi]
MDSVDSDRIIVGVDGSKSSVSALRYAAHLAAALDAPLEAVTTWTAPLVDPYLAVDWSPEKEARDVLDVAVQDAFDKTPPVGLTRSVLHGTPAHTLIELSNSCSMLVLGSRGHGGFAGLLLGSVSAACARHARCPVLIMHAQPELSETPDLDNPEA